MTITDAPTARSYEVRHSTPTLGAEFSGLDLRRGVDDATADALRDAFRERKVLVFRDQHLTPDEHVAAVSIFAEPFDHPTAVRHADQHLVYPYDAQVHGKASSWHIGGLWRTPVFKVESLVYETVPDTGGDTLWADLQAAYDGLSPAFQTLLAGLTASYDADPQNYAQGADRSAYGATTVEHPLVRIDPETGARVCSSAAARWRSTG
jgi:taurine dioxygenase